MDRCAFSPDKNEDTWKETAQLIADTARENVNPRRPFKDMRYRNKNFGEDNSQTRPRCKRTHKISHRIRGFLERKRPQVQSIEDSAGGQAPSGGRNMHSHTARLFMDKDTS